MLEPSLLSARLRFSFAALAAACAFCVPTAVRANTWYVSASAAPGGNGSQAAPLNSLAAVENLSAAGDTIVVLPSPVSVAPLDGGIQLKPRQRIIGAGPWAVKNTRWLPRITNSTATSNAGDAIELAPNDEVRGLAIVNPFRGGIYGSDIRSAVISDNDISGANVSCTTGLLIYFPVAFPVTLTNGWAAILIDATTGTTDVSIDRNYGACSDGIDVRAFGTSVVRAGIEANEVARLAQGSAVKSVLGIGMQTRDTAQLRVTSDYNSESYIGSAGADCEGLFSNQTGGSLTWRIAHNAFAHGIGGASCNGGEFFVGQGPAQANVYIEHSDFVDDAGDMLEENNLGTDSSMSLTLNDVSVRHTSLVAALPPELDLPVPSFGAFTGHGFCMGQFTTGAGASSTFTMADSHFSDCFSDGIFAFTAGLTGIGTAQGARAMLDIERSSIRNVSQFAVHWVNYSPIDRLAIKAQDSVFVGSGGSAILGFDQATGATTTHAAIDFGGGSLGSIGRNCIFGTPGASAQTIGYPVAARDDWWGFPGGPAPGSLSASGGAFTVKPSLNLAPGGCGRR